MSRLPRPARASSRAVAWGLVLTLVAALVAQPLPADSPLGPEPALAAVPESDKLGLEPFYSYHRLDLGAGWLLAVNTFTGNLVLTSELLSIPARGPWLAEALTYNSLSATDAGLGPGWALANDPTVAEQADASVVLRDSDGTGATPLSAIPTAATPILRASISAWRRSRPASFWSPTGSRSPPASREGGWWRSATRTAMISPSPGMPREGSAPSPTTPAASSPTPGTPRDAWPR